jgi:hypothetical protein
MNNPAVATINKRIVLTDIAVLAAVYGIPALAHVTPFPLYYLDPMRLLLMAGYLVSRHGGNAALLALTIPLFSSWVTGHPPFAKAVLIGIELMVNITLLHAAIRRFRIPVVFLVFGSIVISKLIYYAAKALFIQWGWIQDKVIATGLDTQLITAIAVSCAFALLYRRKS